MPRAVVIIPTYNEAENIGRLIDYLTSKIFPIIENWQMKILIVDANSADGTAEIVRDKIKNQPMSDIVHLIVELKREGFGAAYLKGFGYAMNEMRADAVIEFDGDFQHPPEMIPKLLAEIDKGYDYVIGSRKIIGGGEAANRNAFRSLLTAVGSFAARFILFFPGKYFHTVTDPATGLKAIRVKEFLDRLSLDTNHLHSKKFGGRMQIMREILEFEPKYAEIPLQFQNRAAGKSKFRFTTIAEMLWACLKTRLFS